MKKVIYARCSTDKQDYQQQFECIRQYLRRAGETEEIEEVVEKVSGTVKHTKRKLHELLESCSPGSTIYISELSRLGRSMSDLFSIVSYCDEHDIAVIQCKDGTVIENKSIGGKALLFALSLAAEIEVENIRQRTIMGLKARKERMESIGGTNELWGKNTGADREMCILEAQNESSCMRREKARMNDNNRFFWAYMKKWVSLNGVPDSNGKWEDVARDLNDLRQKTATGMEYNGARAAAMYRKLKKIMVD